MRAGPLRSAFRSRFQTTSELLRSKAVGGGRWRKSARELVQVCIRETNESKPIEDASLMILSVVKTSCVSPDWDQSARCLMTERVATGVERA
jgi:hypothetical protein